MRLYTLMIVAIFLLVAIGGIRCSGKVSPDLSPVVSPTTERLTFFSPLTSFPEISEVILFISLREGHSSIYGVSPDGTKTFQILGLTETFRVTGHMDWSPSAKKVAFGLAQGTRSDIFVADLMSSTLHNVTAATASGGSEPRWSPDGVHLAYVCGDYEPDICIISPDGSGYVQLTFHPSRDINPSWSPNGRAIAYQTSRRGLSDIYIINLEDQTEQDLTLGISQNAQPTWSPNGEVILFQSDRNGSMDIFTISLKDSRVTNMTHNEALDVDPKWSPDGNFIAFRSNRDGEWDLFLMRPSQNNPVNLTAGWGPVFTYDWSPDGRYLVFASGRTGNSKIYKVSIESREVVQLTYGPSNDMGPLWISLK